MLGRGGKKQRNLTVPGMTGNILIFLAVRGRRTRCRRATVDAVKKRFVVHALDDEDWSPRFLVDRLSARDWSVPLIDAIGLERDWSVLLRYVVCDSLPGRCVSFGW